jgi:hypothetical protein
MADKIDAILVKLGQPSGPAPLKRWLETLVARDGIKPPVPDAAAVSDPSIAVDLGTQDLELEEVAPTDAEADRGTGNETAALAARTRVEATANNAPTRQDPRAADLAKAARRDRSAEAAATRGIAARFGRWTLRMAIRVALIAVALGAAGYFTWPHLPAWAKRPIAGWLQRLHGPPGSRGGTP